MQHRKLNYIQILAITWTALILCGCGSNGFSIYSKSPYENLTYFEYENADGSSDTENIHSDNDFSQIEAENIYTPSYSEEDYMNNIHYYLGELPPEGYDEAYDNIEYPEFKKYTYYSSTRGRNAEVNVLLPLNYSPDKKYPVVYILHGYDMSIDSMNEERFALVQILTNLQALDEATEMIVVLPNVYCSAEHEFDPGLSLESLLAYDNFINDLTTDLMPFIENNFPAATGKENTAITGFSMGGREAMYIGFMIPEQIGFIGAVAPAPGLVPVEDSELRPGQMQPYQMKYSDEIPYLILISSSKSDGAVGETPDKYCAIMTSNRVRFLSQVMEDAFHNETVVKPHLYMFFRTIFR